MNNLDELLNDIRLYTRYIHEAEDDIEKLMKSRSKYEQIMSESSSSKFSIYDKKGDTIEIDDIKYTIIDIRRGDYIIEYKVIPTQPLYGIYITKNRHIDQLTDMVCKNLNLGNNVYDVKFEHDHIAHRKHVRPEPFKPIITFKIFNGKDYKNL